MERYKSVFKEENLKKQTNAIYVLLNEISIQNPFDIYELKDSFNLPKDMSDLYSNNKENYHKVMDKVNEINDEINTIREILYNYTLSKVAEVQKLVSEM